MTFEWKWVKQKRYLCDCMLLFSCSVMSTSLWPNELQHTRLPCLSPSPGCLLKLMSIESMMPFNHLVLCRPLLLLPSIFPCIRVFSLCEGQLYIGMEGLIKSSAFSATVLPVLEVREEGFEGQMSLENEWGQVLCFLVAFGLSLFTWTQPD